MKQDAGGRPPKPPALRSVRPPLSLPPDLWEEFKQLVPPRERSAAVAEALRREMQRRRRQAKKEGVPVGGDGAETMRGEEKVASESVGAATRKPIWEQLVELANQVPDEEFARLPEDGSEQHDHYIYGTPKRPR